MDAFHFWPVRSGSRREARIAGAQEALMAAGSHAEPQDCFPDLLE